MSENSTHTELLIRYLDGELEGDELQQLRQQVADSSELSAELQRLQLTQEAVKTYGLQKTIGGVHAEMMKELKVANVPANNTIRMIARYSARVAAISVIVLGSALFYQYAFTSPGKLYRDNYQAFVLHEARGSSSLSKLEEPYKHGDPGSVEDAFKTIAHPQAADYFLVGLAALDLHHAPRAVQSFTAVRENNSINNTHFFEEDAEYYLGLAYLQNNEPSKALPIFERIHSDQQHTYHRKISTWFLVRLRKLAAQ